MLVASVTCMRGVSMPLPADRKSTRLNSSHGYISYAVFCLKKKKIASRHSAGREMVLNGEFNRTRPASVQASGRDGAHDRLKHRGSGAQLKFPDLSNQPHTY